MKNVINTISNSKIIIAALIVMLFVTGFSVGYQVSVNYQQCDSDWLNDDVGLVKK